jgi:Holliday junction resolvasome RuvABC DNA-binding subunit
MGQLIAVYWEPLRVQSLVSLGIPLQQFLLGSAVLVAVIAQTSQHALEQKKKRTNLKIFERFASSNEKLVYQIIKELSQKTKETTTQNIASAFEKASDKTMHPNELKDILKNLQKSGIINPDIINIRDQPRLVWKP